MDWAVVPAWRDHRDSGWAQDERPTKRARFGVGSNALALAKPLVWGVKSAVESVQDLTEGLKALHTGDPEAVELQQQSVLQRKIQEARIETAQTFEQWTQAARALDKLDGNDAWRRDDASEDYNVDELKRALAELESARDNENLRHMLQLINQLNRNVAGINNGRLYARTRIGTKHLIERYVVTAVDTITSAVQNATREGTSNGIAKEVHENFTDRREAFGRTALLLSGGGTYGMQHIGVCKAMYEAGVLPQVISGTSAGSIVAAILGTRTDEEISGLLREFCDGELRVFGREPEHLSMWRRLKQLMFEGTFLNIQHLEDVMQSHLQDTTFAEAYNRTGRMLSIALSHVETRGGTAMLCCFKTTPNVLISSAVAASCSIPLIYAPAKLRQKDPITGEISIYGSDNEWYIDGSVSHDLPRARLSELFKANHFIVSQVNPHIAPFLEKEAKLYAQPKPSSNLFNTLGRVSTTALATAASTSLAAVIGEVHSLLHHTEITLASTPNPYFRKLSRAAGHVTAMLDQSYSGDITIFPAMRGEYPMHKVLTNPTPDFMRKAMFAGEVATWPVIERIRVAMAVEVALEGGWRRSMEGVVFSGSQVDLRRKGLAIVGRVERQRGRRRSLRGESRRRGEDVPLWNEAAPAKAGFLPDINSSSDDDAASVPHVRPSYHRRFHSQPTSPSLASEAFIYTPSAPGTPVTESLFKSLTMTPTPAASTNAAPHTSMSTTSAVDITAAEKLSKDLAFPARQPAVEIRPPTPPRSSISSPERKYKARFHPAPTSTSISIATSNPRPISSSSTTSLHKPSSKAPPIVRLSSAIGIPEPHHEIHPVSLPSTRAGSPARDGEWGVREGEWSGLGFSLKAPLGLGLGRKRKGSAGREGEGRGRSVGRKGKR